MTTFRSLIVTLFIGLLVSSCSLFGDDSKVVGTWLLNSDGTEATWIGKGVSKAAVKSLAAKQSSETITYTTPDGNELEIARTGEVESTGEIRVDLWYRDSTITQQTVEEENLDLVHSGYHFEGVEIGPKPYRLNIKQTNANNVHIEVHLQFLYTCGTSKDVTTMTFEFNKEVAEDSLEVYKAAELKTEGFHEVVNDNFCSG